MIFVTGDTHGGAVIAPGFTDLDKLKTANFPAGKTLTKQDYVIICGDFGMIFDVNESSNKEKELLTWLNYQPWTTLFIDGNHENFDRLDILEQTEKFRAPVGIVSDSIFHLRRGYIYTLCGKTFFVMGGANSTDKYRRTEFISWWHQEMPNYRQLNRGIYNLALVNNKVNFILTHTAPSIIANKIAPYRTNYEKKDPLEDYLQLLANFVDFDHWYFGHWHDDFDIGKFTCLYDRVIQIV